MEGGRGRPLLVRSAKLEIIGARGNFEQWSVTSCPEHVQRGPASLNHASRSIIPTLDAGVPGVSSCFSNKQTEDVLIKRKWREFYREASVAARAGVTGMMYYSYETMEERKEFCDDFE